MGRKKRGHGCMIISLTVVFLCVVAVLYTYKIMDEKYRLEKESFYSKKISYVNNYQLAEKAWIRENQGMSGEIYLNGGGGKQNIGDVIPYFSSLAAQGLLTGTPTQEDLDSVRDYLIWHRENFLQAQGEITNYQMIDGNLQSTGKQDSVDSYVAVYLSLLCEYGMLGGDISEVDPQLMALKLGVNTLQKLTNNGLTKTKPNGEIYYWMDNAEVLAAYYNIKHFAVSRYGEKWLGDQQKWLERTMTKAIDDSEAAVQKNLWNKAENRYEVGIGNAKPFHFLGWNYLYPDAIAQVYYTAFDLFREDTRSKELYKTFSENIEWEYLHFGEDEKFNWSVLSLIAVKHGDVKRAEIYLEQYEKKIRQSRAYPIHTADAAWIVKTCDSLEKHYKQRMKTSLLDDILSGSKEDFDESE